MKYPIFAAILLSLALFGSFALAHGPGMMSEMMAHDIQGCMQMMQGMNGSSQLPNEQWRRGQLSPGARRAVPSRPADHRGISDR